MATKQPERQSGQQSGQQPGQQPGQQSERISGAQGSQRGAEQERTREVSRESGTTEGAGREMQRGGQRGGTMARGGSGGRGIRDSSLLPALMANPGLMASAFMSNPFAFAQAMSQEMNRLFDSIEGGGIEGGIPRQASARDSSGMSGSLARGGSGGSTQRLGGWVPPMEVRQRGNDLIVCADLPGLDADDVHIDIEDGMLTISGERRQSSESDEQGYFRSERSYGSFTRAIPLPDGVDEEGVQARFDNGVLEVTVPLPEQRSRARRIQVQSAGRQTSERTPAHSDEKTGGRGRDATGGMDLRPGEIGG